MNPDIPRLGDLIIEDGKASIEFHLFLESLVNSINTTETTVDGITDGTTVISGTWALLDSYTVTGSPANYEYTWDETQYNSIRVIYDGIQPATDATSLYCIVGSGDGSTMYNSASDYDGSEKLYEDAAWSALVDTDQVRLGASFSNAANEVGSGDIEITAGGNADLGCLIDIRLLYINSASNQRANEVKAFLEQSAAIDTIRLFWASGNFANVGTIKVYGLKI